MIGIIIMTYGNLGQEFKSCVEHVLGFPQPYIDVLSLNKEDSMADKHQSLVDMVARLDQGKGVIILTDMFGGIPSDLAIFLLDLDNVEVLAGINLPMLIKLIKIRETKNLQEAVKESQEAGRHYINVASHFLSAANE